MSMVCGFMLRKIAKNNKKFWNLNNKANDACLKYKYAYAN